MTDLHELRALAGVRKCGSDSAAGSNISVTGTEKRELERKHNIKPGTPEWFQLWFSKPYLTGEPPVSK